MWGVCVYIAKFLTLNPTIGIREASPYPSVVAYPILQVCQFLKLDQEVLMQGEEDLIVCST